MKVLIADDHELIRRGLKQILTEELVSVSIEEAEDGAAVLPKIQKNQYDLIILDITMPGRNGMDLLKDIKTEFPKLPVLVLSIHPEEQYALRTLKAGASGFLNKASAPEELITAIRKVAQGAKYITSTLAEQLVQNLDDDEQKPHQRLSNREYQVMTLIASGKTVKEIAESLHISIKTVSTYRTRILEKMNFKNNAHIMHYSIKNNLI